MRSHPRSTASLRLRLEWDEGEARRTANGLTVDVSHSGCMAVIGADVPLRRQVRLVLPETGAVRKAKSSGVDTKLGKSASLIAEPDAGFWVLSRSNPLLNDTHASSTHYRVYA